MKESIRTRRLELVPASLAHLDAELASQERLADLLNAAVPAGWPPGEYDRPAMEFFRKRLAERPSSDGWYGWYAVLHDDGQSTLVAAGGYFGPPSTDGTVEVGYSVVPAYQRRGIATELVEGLAAHAFSFPAVQRMIAQVRPENQASIRVLERCGFVYTGPGEDASTHRFSLLAPKQLGQGVFEINHS